MRHLAVALTLMVATCLGSSAWAEDSAGYDPTADPFADLQAAQETAAAEDKNILLKVGGNWCSWCRLMEKFIHDNQDLEKALNEAFVVIKVSYSDDNKNEQFLSKFPPVPGYPHLFVLNPKGELLHSQDSGVLESGRGYSKEAFFDLIHKWSSQRGDS